jgi:hypothetical protein
VDLAERTFIQNRWTQAAREQIALIERQVLSLYEDLPDSRPPGEAEKEEPPQKEPEE